MKQYHLTFFCNEQPQTTLFYIVRAENLEDAIKSIEYKVKKTFVMNMVGLLNIL